MSCWLELQGKSSPVTRVTPIAVEHSRPTGTSSRVAATPKTRTKALIDHAKELRVLLVDDHSILRQGLSLLLQEEPDITIVGEAADGRQAVELTRRIQPDVVVMDITMPIMNGIEATRRIVAEHPQVRVIGLSMHETADMDVAMRDAGAAAYLPKGGPLDLLTAAIRGATLPTES